MKTIRDLRPDEVECRVATVTAKGISLLLYKNARCDMNILDEIFGAENWQRKHYECKGNLFCEIGVKIDGEWVWKGDCGTESYTEKEKGEASYSFKRAGFNWGIGRELYTAPFIWLKKGDYKEGTNSKGETVPKDNFIVKEMRVENKKIVSLLIYSTGMKKDVFSYGMNIEPNADYEVDLKKSCRNYVETLVKLTGKTDKEIYAEAKKRANSEDLSVICDVLVKMLKEASK
jgi:hypothetical protein